MSEFQKKINELEELNNILNEYKEIIKDKIKENKFLEQIQLFKKEYSNLIGIKRFCIPIIGKCNSGKSTFLNYLLKQKVLEIKDEISTKFICIIRHDSEFKFPKIYKVNIKERAKINGKTLYNFEEGEEIDTKGDIAQFIKDKNEKEINIGSMDPKDYFLIMKINIPFFNEKEFAPYSNFFELMDIPGLSEDDYYIEKLFPYFIDNSKFCFFIFDAVDYPNDDTKNIFNNISEKFENKNKIYKNSLFILNKIDEVNKESVPNEFKNYMKHNLKTKIIDCICCNSKSLHLNHFKLESFLNYLEYIFSKPKVENNDEVNEYIEANIKEHFGIQIKYSDEQYNTNQEQEKEFDDYRNNENILENNYNKLDDINKYIYYKRIFDENKNKKGIKDDDEIKNMDLKIKKKILNSCKTIYDSNLNIEKFNDLKDEIIKKCHIIIKKKINKKNPFKNEPKIILDNFKEIIDNLKTLKGEHQYIKAIVDEFKLIENFFQIESKLRIPTLGCISSGKSLLLNNLIGHKILPVGSGGNTKIGIVINYTDSINKICLKKTILKQSTNFLEDYYCFEDEKDNIYSKLENMEKILKIINISYSYDNKFADLIIKFIKKYEEIKINPSLIEIVNLIEKILTKKQVNDLKSLVSILNSLKNEEKISYKEIIDTLNKIRKNEIRINNKKNQEEQNEFFLKLIIPIKILDDMKLEKDIKEKIELIDIPGLNTEQKYLENKHFKTLIKYSNGFLFVTKKNQLKKNPIKILFMKQFIR